MSRVPAPDPSAPAQPLIKPSPLLERLRLAAQERGDARPTADKLVNWARALIRFHNKRHPSELGLAEATHFLDHIVKTPLDLLDDVNADGVSAAVDATRQPSSR